MDLKCANPLCNSKYEHGNGRLLRIKQAPSQETQPANWHAVKHYWLCTECSAKFTIEFQKDTGVILTEKLEEDTVVQPTYTLLQPMTAPKPEEKPLLTRLNRSRARHRKQNAELVPASGGSPEILEIRKNERRG